MLQNIKKGFTLVELLVVITILGILATYGIGMYAEYQAKARDGKRISDIKEMVTHLDAWDGGGMPKNLNAIKNNFKGASLPTDPKNSFGYQYNVFMEDANIAKKTMGGTQYVICTNRPLEQFSTKDGDVDMDKLASLDIGELEGKIYNGSIGGFNKESRLNGYFCDGNIDDLAFLVDGATITNADLGDVVASDKSGDNTGKRTGTSGPSDACTSAQLDYKGLLNDGEPVMPTQDEMKEYGKVLGSACKINFSTDNLEQSFAND